MWYIVRFNLSKNIIALIKLCTSTVTGLSKVDLGMNKLHTIQTIIPL